MLSGVATSFSETGNKCFEKILKKKSNKILCTSLLKKINEFDAYPQKSQLSKEIKDLLLNKLHARIEPNLTDTIKNGVLLRELVNRINSLKLCVEEFESKNNKTEFSKSIKKQLKKLNDFSEVIQFINRGKSAKKDFGGLIYKLFSFSEEVKNYFLTWDIPSILYWTEENPFQVASISAEDSVRSVVTYEGTICCNVTLNDEVICDVHQKNQNHFTIYNALLTKIYEAGFASEWCKNYKNLNVAVSDQTHILLKLGRTRSIDTNFQAEVKEILIAESINWGKLKEMFSERLACMTIPWDAVIAKWESLPQVTEKPVDKLLTCIVPAFEVLQLISINSFSYASELINQAFPKFGQGHLFSFADIRVESPHYMVPTFDIYVKNEEYKVSVNKTLGICPKFEFDPKKNVDKGTLWGVVKMVWQISNLLGSHGLHKGELRFPNLVLTEAALLEKDKSYRWKLFKNLNRFNPLSKKPGVPSLSIFYPS